MTSVACCPYGPTSAAGQRVARGEVICLAIGAANRDPAVFPRPDELDLDRVEAGQLAFGGPACALDPGLGPRWPGHC